MVSRYAKLMPDVYREEVIQWWQDGPEGMIGREDKGAQMPSYKESLNKQAPTQPRHDEDTLLLARALMVAQEIIEEQQKAILRLEKSQRHTPA